MRFRSSEKTVAAWLGAGVYISGVSLFLFSHWIRVSSAIGEQHHAFEFWNRLGHTTLTYLVVLGFGYLIKSHVLPSLRSNIPRRKQTGIGLLFLFASLVVSALTILYAGEGNTLEFSRWTHALIGICLPVFLLLHLTRPKAPPGKF